MVIVLESIGRIRYFNVEVLEKRGEGLTLYLRFMEITDFYFIDFIRNI